MTICQYCHKNFKNLDTHLQKNKICHGYHILPDDKKPFCHECKQFTTKLNTFFEYYVCAKCSKNEKYSLITKTRAKKEYLLNDNDLETLHFISVKNPHFSSASEMILFLKSDVEELSKLLYIDIEKERAKRQEILNKKRAVKMRKNK